MKLTSYRYTGPQSSASLRLGDTGELLEVQLLPDHPTELPADHDYTKVLLALKHLHLLPPKAKPTGKAPVAAQNLEKE
ncbi:hypothetical protein ACM1ZW_20785 [Pseudomonas sp. NFX71]|uniref:hypothetical protein n=1 Tax=Pseudomonas sp. NFX71 TaxID=3399121 RepID=UPI003A86ADA9